MLDTAMMDHSTVQGTEEQTLQSMFARVCGLHADRPALTCAGVSLSYAELQAQARRVAAGLQQAGIAPGALVGILLERSSAMIVAMLGVIEAGAAYLPLDVRYPAQRLAETIADATPAAVIVERGSEAREYDGVRVLFVEDLLASAAPANTAESAPRDVAYVIYTSGSTGKPKGVVVSNRNVVRLVSATASLFNFTENDVWTCFHSFAFDFSVWEIWGCLLHGGRLVMVPFETSRDPEEFHALLGREQVMVLNQTPSAFALLDAADALQPEVQLALRVVIFGGEALSGSILRGWIGRHGDAFPVLVNMYGITETTVHVTFRRMLATDCGDRDSLIGEPIADLRLYLLDEQLRPVEEGCEGELCIGGAGVAGGYLNRPQLTADRFVRDPFGTENARMYRSGDMARRRADGELVYMGRRDGQVKHNGFRIELGEIECALAQHAGVTQACVVLDQVDGSSEQLTAYYTAANELALGPYLAARLPAHMRPARYVHLLRFPLNANGKIDRGALSAAVPQLSPFAAEDAAQARVAAVWRAQLGHSDFSADDNFFDIGGSSLLLIAARKELEREFARAIPVSSMFAYTTLRSLAEHLASTRTAADPAPAVRTNAEKQRLAFARARARSGGGR